MLASVRIVTFATVALISAAGLTGCSSSGPSASPAPTSSAAATSTPGTMGMSMPTGSVTASAPTASHLVDPAAFATAIATKGTVTIDVHVPFEGKIAGTNLMIPYTDIAAQASKLPADHHTELAIYCRTGVMSAIAAKSLASLGYTDVVELRGGMHAWEASGRTLLETP
jgi:phage shock protein E